MNPKYVSGALLTGVIVLGVLLGYMYNLNNQLSTKYLLLQKDYEALTNDYNELQADYAELTQNYNSLQSNYTVLNEAFATLSDEYDKLSAEHEALKTDYANLQAMYEDLTSRYSELNSSYVSLKASYTELTTKYNDLKAEHDKLTTLYTSLTSNYTRLLTEHNSLKTQYSLLQNTYNNLNQQYNELQSKYETLLETYDEILTETTRRAGLDNDYKPNFIDWWSTQVKDAVDSINFNAYDDPYEAIYWWIYVWIDYNFDTPELVLLSTEDGSYVWWADYYQYASETLDNGYGDCEDLAILAAAMVEQYWSQEYGDTYLIWVVEANVKYSIYTFGHDFTIIPFVGNKIAIIDPALGVYIPPKDTLTALQEYEQKSGVKIDTIYGVFSIQNYNDLNIDNIYDFAEWLNTH